MTKIFIAMLQAKNFEGDRDKISATKSSVNNVAIVVLIQHYALRTLVIDEDFMCPNSER